MSKRRPSLMEYMRQQNLVQNQTEMPLEDMRREVESSPLVCDMESTAKAINKAAGSLLIDVQSYLWPEPIIRSFSVHKYRQEFVMQLELWTGQLFLTYVCRRGKGTFLSRYLPWVFAHWLGLHEVEIIIKSSAQVNPDMVSGRNIEEWFIYLLSGFDSTFTPAAVGTEVDERTPGRTISVAAAKAS